MRERETPNPIMQKVAEVPPFSVFPGGAVRVSWRGGAFFSLSKMAASVGLFRAWRRQLNLGLSARRNFWGRQKKKEDAPVIVEPVAPVKEAVVCPPPRSRKYFPPEDLQSRLESHVREIFGSSVSRDWQKTSLADFGFKYHLLAQMAADLGHTVPNNQLHYMKSAGDVLAFYSTPVKDISKLDELSMQELPPNLKITWESEAEQSKLLL